MSDAQDIHYMRAAMNMARRGIGRTAENPSVGCVIVKDGVVLAMSRTADGGRPHAEPIALAKAKESAKGATLYVTLEPCAHHGKTPPCVDAIIAAGIKRVVIGIADPDPRTGGASIEKMKNVNIQVECNVLHKECLDLHSGFISRIVNKRPYVTLKAGCTLDGKIACANGESKWITGDLARKHVHHIRAKHDAILTGINTVLYDDPMLTSRVNGVDHKIMRVVLDRHLRIKKSSNLVQSAKQFPLLVLHECEPDQELINLGVKLHQVDCDNLVSVLGFLASEGVNNLLVEGGAQVQTSFLRAECFDELLIYRAPTILGQDAKPVVSDMNIDTLTQRLDLQRIHLGAIGNDIMEIYKK